MYRNAFTSRSGCGANVNRCAQCGAYIVAPERAEHAQGGRVRNVWSCETCGHRFEQFVSFSAV